jgi:hypothetical protein
VRGCAGHKNLEHFLLELTGKSQDKMNGGTPTNVHYSVSHGKRMMSLFGVQVTLDKTDIS